MDNKEEHHRRMNQWPAWPNARDWIGIATVVMSIMILWMMKDNKALREDEFFKVIATLIIGTGFVNGIIGWAYGSTKASSDREEKRLAEHTPQPVVVENEEGNEVPVKETKK